MRQGGMKVLSCSHTLGTDSFSDYQAMEDVLGVTDHMIVPSRRLRPETPADKDTSQQCDGNLLMEAVNAETCQSEEKTNLFCLNKSQLKA